MAIYHFSAKVIGRSSGRSAVASAAYRAAERLHDNQLDRDHDYTAKAGVVHSEILLPDGAPARWLDRATLWNEVEASERQHNAQLARDIEISLPRELGQAEAIRLAQDFVREQFVKRGMVADLNVHWTAASDGALQPHAHVMLSLRGIEPGRGPAGHEGESGFGLKERGWNDRGLLGTWRERWASLANGRLAKFEHDVRIDHRSYAAQGIALEPQNKIGPAGMRRAQRAEDAERAAEHQAIARRNGELIIADPHAVLDAITRQQSTFTRRDVLRFVHRHTADGEQFDRAVEAVQASPELVRLGEDGRGQARFSTREMLAAEQRMERAAAALSGRRTHGAALERRRAAVSGAGLGREQELAFGHVTRARDLVAVVGYAGTGKSTMLKVARAAWEAEGYRVRGAALSGIAAEGLEGGSGIQSRTLASLEYGWKEGRDLLTGRDVLVVDEAGMVGSRQMERVLSQAQAAGAKVVLVGDPEQLQAIEAGAAFRAIVERVGAAEITEVQRQHEPWQRAATRELATGRTGEALRRYEAAGMVNGHATQDEAQTALVAVWDAERRAAPGQSRVMLAYRRADVLAMNRLARERLREAGELGPEQVVQTERGERAFAAGDRVMFLRNERALGAGPDGRGGVAVRNGTLGTVLGVEGGGRLTVRLDRAGPDGGAGPEATFSVGDYGHVEHGYAATTHKAQSVTVDRAHVLASGLMDRHAAYVALTRHRDGVALHWSAEEMGDRDGLARSLSREQAKDTSLDYGPAGEAARAYAERRGLDPLRPESEIVVRPEPEPPTAAEPVAEPARVGPRPGRFGGLRLGAGQGTPRPVPVRVPEPAPEPVRPETQGERLMRGLEGYARAWADAGRMGRAGLPVLPHQEAALRRAGEALEREGAGLARDAAASLERSPALAGLAAGGQAGRVALFGQAVEAERRGRQALEERGRAAVQAWGKLERAHDAAAGRYEWDAARAATKKLEAFAQALKRDAALEGVLRERGPALGVAAGGRLARVLAMGGAAAGRELAHELRLEQALRQSPGMSPGR